jgi:uncharacterized membrane protein
MIKFVVIVFPSSAKAEEGRKALQALHNEGTLTVYAAAVLDKDTDGRASVKHEKGPGPLGTGLAALLGGLIGLIGGPAVAVFGAAAGAVSGGWFDVLRLGSRVEFLEEVTGKLESGHSAVLAEVAEDRTGPLDTRMEALGGVVIREPRPAFEEESITKQIKVQRLALTELEAECAGAQDADRARLKIRIAETQAKLKEASERARIAMSRLREETDAKIAALEDQAARATDGLKEHITRRAVAIRADHDLRSEMLQQAFNKAEEALG